MAEDYVAIQGKARYLRDGAVLFAVGEGLGQVAWIPRSLIHGADDSELSKHRAVINAARSTGHAMTLRIFRWKAEETGLLTDQDNESGDLFSRGKPI